MSYRFERLTEDNHPMAAYAIMSVVMDDAVDMHELKSKLWDAYGMGREARDTLWQDVKNPWIAPWYWDFGSYTFTLYLTEESQITYVKLLI